LKKDRNRSFSRFDTNLVKKTERERGEKVLLKMPIWAERDKTQLLLTCNQTLLVLSHAVPFYQPHATRPHAAPQTTWRNTSAQNVQIDGFLPSELLLRVSDIGLGKTEEKLRGWGKLSTTNDPRARK
jgi:hypothetical protein